MNEDTLKGQWTQLKGRVREQWGKLTDDDLDQIQGKDRAARRPAAGALWLGARRGQAGSGRLAARDASRDRRHLTEALLTVKGRG